MDNLYLKSLSEDNEFICDNKNMKEILLPNENILFSNKIQRIKKNTQEERIIVLTDRYLYNLRKKKYHNKADIRNITGITVSKKSNEFVVHTCEMEDDFHYDSDKRSFILELIARIYYCQTRKKIDLSVVEPGFLDDYVTQKSDKKNNKGKIRLNANLALKLANSSKVEIKDISLLENETVDDALLRVSEVLATNDIELKKRAKAKGITVVYLRQKNYITVDGKI